MILVDLPCPAAGAGELLVRVRDGTGPVGPISDKGTWGRTVLPLMRLWLCAVSFKHFEDLFGVHVPALAAFAQVAQLEYGFL